MNAHGGYCCRVERLDGADLAALGREALCQDGEAPGTAALLVSVLPGRRVVRLAYDSPHTYGRRGAHWYGAHHALAELCSSALGVTVHAYVYDPDALEQVVAYGSGRRVGGETVRYDDVELEDDEVEDEQAFERVRDSWPLGRLARLMGLDRRELLRLPFARSALIPLDGDAGPLQLDALF